jgi:hypothetical protein
MSGAEDGDAWRVRDLRFLKSTHDRLQAELVQHAGDSVEASLRRGQQALVQSMAAIAQAMPANTIPPEVRPLLAAVPAAPKTDETAAVPPVAAPLQRSAELRPGFWRIPEPDLGGLALPADLRASPEPPRSRRKPKPDKPAVAEKPATGEKPAAREKANSWEKAASVAAVKD